ncbi:uncharacterized protein LOC143890252 [Tasmannia lanceolata]|uniref:uncharacterized protein LOC143890252 n=1 Tax=Tasmannia lanceolata TaxID=3420 RepID=UPI0040637F9A
MVGQTGKRAPPTSRATRATAPREGRSERLASQVEVGAAVERTSPHSDRSDPTPTPREMRALFQEMTAVVAQFRNAAPALQQHPVEVSRPVQRGESSRRERASPPRDQTRHSTRRDHRSRDRNVRPEPRQHYRSRSPSVQKRGSKRDPMHGEGSRHRRRSPLSQSGSARSPSAVRSRPARLAEQRDDPMLLRIQKIDNRIEELARDHGRPASRIFSSNPPFTDRVLGAAVPLGFKMPQIPQYDGTTDPVDHLQTFRTTMLLHGASDGFLCRALPTTLTGAARDWYSRLKPKSVDNFDDFGDDLARHFMSSRRPRKTTASLMALRQEDGEALKAFVGRFNREALQVPNLDPSAATNALLAGARSTDFRRAVARRNPQSLADLMTGAEEYISVEETLAALDSVSKRRPEEKNPIKQRRDDRPQRKESSPSRKERSSPRPRKERSPPTRERYTPLTASRAQILAAIRKEDFIRWPKKQTPEAGTQDMSRYCRFHKSRHGHDTNACIHLKEEIEQLISRGYLGRYLKNNDNRRERQDNSRPRDRSPRDAQPLGDRIQAPAPAVLPPQVPQPQLQPHGVIGTISGGPTAGGGTSSSARRTYARQVNAVHTCSKRAEPENEISFSEADLDGLILPHDDALVVTMLVANWEMKKILVDNGSSADILYYHAFEQMMIGADRLKPANSDLFGFSGEVVKVEGQIELPVLIGEPPRQSFAMVTFLVVKAKSAYNAILGRPGQNLLRAIPSAYHQKMKFITPGGVGEVRGDQPQSRQCYAAALRGKNASESLPIELYDLRDEAQVTVNEPAEDLISIQLNIDDEQRVVQIGSALPEAAQQDLAQFLRANADVFAWTPSDMPGIDPSISTHELGVDQTCKPVKHKRRHFAPEPGEELILYLSAGPLAVAAVLIKEESNQQRPIYYVSKVLHDVETRYQRVEKLVCALIMAARKLRPYFQAHTIKVLTGQPLRQILHRPDTSGRLVKWAVELSEFDIKYLPRPAIKAQILADFIAECTVPDPDPGLVAVPSPEAEPAVPEPRVVFRASPPPGTESVIAHPVFDEEPLWEVYVDGSSNKTGCGAGLVLTGPEDFVLNYALRFGFRASNNEAEYEALIAGMNLAVQTRAQRLRAYCDSQLVVCQIQGVYEAREERMIKYLGRVRSLAVHFKSFEVVRIPRAENVKADVLSKLAASGYTALREIRMEFLKRSSIDAQSVVVMQIDDEPCWMDEIIRYLRSGELPGERKEARKVTQRAARFSLDGETLYKRSYTLPYLKCLRPSDALLALQETHEGICGEHLGGKALAIKILLRGLYWPTLRKDALSLVKKCEKCQKFSPTVHRPPVPMAPIISPLPFAVWGMDILGPFPPASGGREFVVVAIDYFTKWVEAEPLAKITEQNVQNFFWKSVVCRFGIPRVLITDNGKQFDSRNFRKFCSDLHIEQRFTSVAHPQTNGQTEVTNRTLLQGIKKRLDGKAGRWADELYHVLWAYRTTPRTATGESPFNLSFGTEAVIPVDIGVPSPRIVHFSEQLNGDGLRANLDLLEEVREESQIRSAAYKQKVSRYHDVKIRPREFRAGHLVLRKASVSQPRSVGKLSPTWEGPYRIKEVIRPGSYRLESLDEQMLPHAWNSRNLRIYYQ